MKNLLFALIFIVAVFAIFYVTQWVVPSAAIDGLKMAINAIITVGEKIAAFVTAL